MASSSAAYEGYVSNVVLEIETFETTNLLEEDLKTYSKVQLALMTSRAVGRSAQRSSNIGTVRKLSNGTDLFDRTDATPTSQFIDCNGKKKDVLEKCVNYLKEATKKPTVYLSDVMISSRVFDVEIYGSTRGAAEICLREKANNHDTMETSQSWQRTALLVLTKDKIRRLSLPEAPTAVEAEVVDSFFEDVQQGRTDEEVRASWVHWFWQWSYRIEIQPEIYPDPDPTNSDLFYSSITRPDTAAAAAAVARSKPQRGATLQVQVKPLEVPTHVKDFKWNLSSDYTSGTGNSNTNDRIARTMLQEGSGYVPLPSKKQVAVFFRDTDATTQSRRSYHD